MQYSKHHHAKFTSLIRAESHVSKNFLASPSLLTINTRPYVECLFSVPGMLQVSCMQTDNMQTAIAQHKPHFSIPSLIAVGAAIACFFVRPAAGFALAIVALFFGLIGLILSFAPSIRGGIVSFFSLILASFGIIFAIVKGLLHAHL